MMNNKTIYIILLIVIIIISVILSNLYVIDKEGFADSEEDPEPTTNSSGGDVAVGIDSRTSLLSNFKNTIDRFKYLEIPITITNTGRKCSDWGNYENGKYEIHQNTCIKMEGRSINQCLVNGEVLSCNDFFTNGVIDKNNNIDTKVIYDRVLQNIDGSIDELNTDFETRRSQLDKLLNNLIARKNIENQQLYFINYNDTNMESKEKMFNKTNTEYEKTENEYNINTVNFSNMLQKNKQDENTKDFYYKILKYIIITLIIVVILNILFSELL